MTLFLTSLLMFSMYAATLTSFLAVTKITLPFDSIETLHTMTNYRVVTWKNSVYETQLQHGSEIEKKIYWERLDGMSTWRECIDKMSKGNYALLGDSQNINSVVSQTCKIVKTKTVKRSPVAMIMTKDSMYKDIFNY